MTKADPPPSSKGQRTRVQSPSQLKCGMTINGSYRIRRKIATGGTAWVFEATHINTGRRVAIKVLNDRYRSERSLVKRFANEARASMSIDSPHVVRVEAVGRFNDCLPFLVMEFLEGADLYQVLKEAGWRLPVEDALNIVDQVARALEVAHAQGIVHRDIKPENIFVVDTNNGPLVKVVDFGLSRVPRAGTSSGLTTTGMTVGTPQYMALEQLKGDKSIDGRADIYALGVLTYELLSGRCPFEGDDPQDVMRRAARQLAPPLSTHRPDLPKGLLNAVAHAMARNRDERCPTAQAFRESIRPFWSGKPTFEDELVVDIELDEGPEPSPVCGTSTLLPEQTLPRPDAHSSTIQAPVPAPTQAPVSAPVPGSTQGPLPAPTNSTWPLATRSTYPPPIKSTLPPPASNAPTSNNRGILTALLIAALALALGLTCFLVDRVHGTPGVTVQSFLLL